MPTPQGLRPQELLKKAEELRQSGSSTPAGRASGPTAKFTRTQVLAGQEGAFERLLRFSLYNQNSIENLQCGSNVVIILQLKTAMQEQLKFYEEARPTVSQDDGMKGVFKPHPLGERKVYLLVALLEALDKVGQLKNTKYLETFAKLASTDTEVLEFSVGMFAPRFPTPKEGRPWVFELVVGALATEEFRSTLRELVAISTQFSEKSVRIELARKGQTELKKALWDDLRAIQGAGQQ